MGLVSCSNCGREFRITGQYTGFSHCDQHDQLPPLPDEGFLVTLELSSWSRLPEVMRYAERQGISLETAIRDLVTGGLSWDPNV